MKYNLIGENNFLSPLEQVLKNRGIQDIKGFLKAGNDKSVTNHYSKLDNINAAVDCLIKHVRGDNGIFVQVDSDP